MREVAVIQAYDHFSSENPAEKMCIAEFVGIIVEETTLYVKLKHITADINKPFAEEYHFIFKKAIVRSWKFKLLPKNEEEITEKNPTNGKPTDNSNQVMLDEI